MSREKQIEEISKLLGKAVYTACEDIPFAPPDVDDLCIRPALSCLTCKQARVLIEAGYRKQSEGEWMVYGNCNNRRAMCSNCKKEFAVQKGMLQLQHFPYCPLCGARMRDAKMKGGAE